MLKYLDEYRDSTLCLEIAEKIRSMSTRPLNIMEVCGGHTMSIRKHGIHKLLGDNIKLISGPGCPVCVTSIRDINKVIALASVENAVICTYGDMIYVPGTSSSLAKTKADGKDIRTVYSVHDVINFAKEEKDKNFIFISIGFETTAPTAAAAIKEAAKAKLNNFFILSLNKTMPDALRAVLADEGSIIDSLLCPGHVSTITGTGIYEFIVNELGVSCCVSGFEPADILKAIYLLTEIHEKDKKALLNAYTRVVKVGGNEKAQKILDEVFEPADVDWRGIGVISGSGLALRETFSKFDAEKVFDVTVEDSSEIPGCICGDILRGAKRPVDCTLFKKTCTPIDPKGACMVSSEGTCAAWFKYGEE